jgi:hypothetical protein
VGVGIFPKDRVLRATGIAGAGLRGSAAGLAGSAACGMSANE